MALADQLADSAAEITAIWPIVSDAIGGGGRLVPNEGIARDPALLDMLAGVDYWLVRDRLYGAASRVHWPAEDQDFSDFTMRRTTDAGSSDTEFSKRAAEQDTPGSMTPLISMEAYMRPPRRSGVLLRCGVARTADIVAYVRHENAEKPNGCYWRQNQAGATFYIIPFASLARFRNSPVAVVEMEEASLFGRQPGVEVFNGAPSRLWGTHL